MKIDIKTVLWLVSVYLIMSVPSALAHTDVTAEEARELIDTTEDLTVIDVREPYEYSGTRGHIPGALNYPWNSEVLQARYEELSMIGPILVVCGSGHRSNQAATFLDSKGFSMIYDMMRGMNSWKWETVTGELPDIKYSGGTGEPNDPYQIATAEDLILLGETPEDYDKHFILTADIDLDPNLPGRQVFNKAVIAPDTNDAEDGFHGTPFTGVFDGTDHTISHLTINGASYLGLFGLLGTEAKISNLVMEAVDVNGTSDCVGGLVGQNDGSIDTCYSNGTVTGIEDVGALVGENEGSITTSYSTGSVTGDEEVGGLVGDNSKGNITVCYSTGTVTGNEYVGGLVGYNDGIIIASYSVGTVTGQGTVGGLVGFNWGNITTSYSTGTVTGDEDVGGLVGHDNGSVVASFWDRVTAGWSTSSGGTGITTTEMQNINVLLYAGWDFVDEVANGTCDYWKISPGDYPRLHYHADNGPVMPEGLGTTEDPYLIRNARDLGTVWFKPMAHYRLEASLDLSGITWSMAVPWFDGTFEGNGYMISNLHIQGGTNLGLFGQLNPEAKISNLGLEAVNVEGGYSVGGLVGENYGSISTCFSTGTITGDDSVGGLVGYNEGKSITMSYSTATVKGNGYEEVGGLVGYNDGSITMSYSTGTVTGNENVGGLVGENHSTITTCYSNSMVTGDEDVGGLVGYNDGSITTSYNTGIVYGNSRVGGIVGNNAYTGNITSSFWDMETSGQVVSAGGTGKSTAEMQTASTFIESGWDFVGETDNGTEDIWSICEGTNYPRFVWQIQVGDFVCPDGITIDDFLFFLEHWLDDNCDLNNGYCEGTDLDQSGSVDVNDLEIFLENWPDKN